MATFGELKAGDHFWLNGKHYEKREGRTGLVRVGESNYRWANISDTSTPVDRPHRRELIQFFVGDRMEVFRLPGETDLFGEDPRWRVLERKWKYYRDILVTRGVPYPDRPGVVTVDKVGNIVEVLS